MDQYREKDTCGYGGGSGRQLLIKSRSAELFGGEQILKGDRLFDGEK